MENLVLCTPVKAELWYGACKSEHAAANQSLLPEFFAQLPSLPFDDKTIENYGEIRALPAKAGTPIGAKTAGFSMPEKKQVDRFACEL